MTSDEIHAKSEALKQRATQHLNAMFKIPEGYNSDAVAQIVDDIVAAAVLEITSIHAKAAEPRRDP